VSAEEPWAPDSAYDAGLRFDVVDGLLDAWLLGEPSEPGVVCAWITRPGGPELHDRDLGWFAAGTAACEAHGLQLEEFRAVTRTGWLDVRTGERRVWKRLRL
jgi:hypothetical protein